MIEKLMIGVRSLPRKTAEIAAKVNEIIDSLGSSNILGGYANYINGSFVPIPIPASTETKLTLDASTGTIVDNLPDGVTSVWNSTTGQFDFSELAIGDRVRVRVDGSLSNTGFDESYKMDLIVGIGSAKEFALPLATGNRLFSGTSTISRYNGFYVGSQEMIDNPAEIRVTTTDAASGFLIDLYVEIDRKSA
ncbi:hypothetical protein NVP1032O_09 [Vibrio phage 1.032.O._10N.261.54.F5]|nr:hypothetical protein NVP1032O_09 [Vibrio phage 1.032.O._10N.261.54.F5]